ncbi:MAG: ADP-forming succinate--CoA ligase subunit beta [Salinarimonadaceae bacterium]|nr:MAG: ADP-forming succinate--CoA ligase subunit beta [Salinarimonadaceae bacterium]
MSSLIKLFEFEGKALLAGCGLPIPAGALSTEMPDALDGALVVKAQVLAGGRGKAGGIRFARDRGEALAMAGEIQGSLLGENVVEAVYIEERLDIAREFYLAALVDRDLGMPVLLASAEGGVEIESVAPEKILRQPVDPLIGLQPFMVERLARGLGLSGEPAKEFSAIAGRLYEALVSQDAELVEINPLALTVDGRFVAADAKVALDEDAAFRHPGRRAKPAGTAFELEARDLDVIGVETGEKGGIVAVMNGAGLTMATLDEVLALGGRMSGVIELHGAMMNGPERICDIIEIALRRLEPVTILVNIHFQFRSLVTIAEGVALAMKRFPELTADRLVLRLRGEEEEEARAILAGSGVTIFRDFGPACAGAVERAAANRG